MPFGQRVFVGTGGGAEGDKLFAEFIYNDTTGNLSYGMPLYIDVTDAAEWNNRNNTTKLSPAVAASGGKVVLGDNANATNLCAVGIFQPENPSFLPTLGDPVRVLVYGRGIVAAVTYNAGTAVLVGDWLVVDTTPGRRAASGHNTPVAAKTLGLVCATGTAVATGNSILATGGGTVTALVNAFVTLR